MNSPKELLEDFLRKTEENAELTSELKGEFQYDFSPSDDGVWTITFADGKATYVEGPAANPVVTFKAKFDTFVDLYTGKLNATTAILMGKVKLKGSMSEALKIQQFL